MKDFRFIEIAETKLMHLGQIERYGGAHGVRDEGLLKSALHVPQSGFFGIFFHKDIFEVVRLSFNEDGQIRMYRTISAQVFP